MDLSHVLGLLIIFLNGADIASMGPIPSAPPLTPSKTSFQADHPPLAQVDPPPPQEDFTPARPDAFKVYWWQNPPYVHLEDGRAARYGVAERLNDSAFAGLFLPILSALGQRCGRLLDTGQTRVGNPLYDPNYIDTDDLWGYVRLPNQLELLTQLAESDSPPPSSPPAAPHVGRTTLYLPFTWRNPAPTPPEDALWVVPLVESPGAVHFLRKELEPAASDLTDVIRQAWPLVIMILLGAAYSGIIIWLLDRLWNPTNFPKPFIRGFWEGFWWAFVTMTTVGYGDTTPRSIQARIFGLVWIVVGITILSVFTATVTTVLTQSSLISHNALHGIRVGVLNGSEEYSLAVALGAKAIPAGSFEDLVLSMDLRLTQAAIVDQYVFAVNQHRLQDNYLLDKVYPYQVSHGMVVRNANPALRRCVSTYLAQNRLRHVTQLASQVPPLTVRTVNNLNKSQDLFQPETVIYVFYGMAVWVVIFLAFVIWEFAYWTPKHRRRKALKEEFHGKKLDEEESMNTNLKPPPSSTVTLFTRPKSRYSLPSKKASKRRGKSKAKSNNAHLPSKGKRPPFRSGSSHLGPAAFINGGFEDPCPSSHRGKRIQNGSVLTATDSASSDLSQDERFQPVLDRQFREIKNFEEDFLKFRKDWVKKVTEAKVRHRKELRQDLHLRLRRAKSLPNGLPKPNISTGGHLVSDTTTA